MAGLGRIVGAVRFVGRSTRKSRDTLPQPTEYLSLEEGAWSEGPLGHQGRNSDRQDRGPCPSSGKQQLWSHEALQPTIMVANPSMALPPKLTEQGYRDYRSYQKTHNLFQSSSVVQSCPTLCNSMDCSMPGFPVHHQLTPRACSDFMSIESVMPSNHLILCCPFLLLPSNFPNIRVFSNGSVLHIRWPKYWSFSFSISPSNEYSGLISFRMDWLDLLAVQGTLKSLLQHHSLKASILCTQLSL